MLKIGLAKFPRIRLERSRSSTHSSAEVAPNEGSEQAQGFKVTIVTQFYPPDFAATGQLIQELAAQLEQQGIDVNIFTGQPGYAFNSSSAPTVERCGNVLIRRSRTSRLWSQKFRGKAVNRLLFCIRAALHLLSSRWRGDVLLLTSAPPFLQAVGYWANLCFGVPYVCLIYDLYPEVVTELKVLPSHHWIVKLWDAVNARVWQRSQSVIVLSSTMKERIVTKHPHLAPKISTIHNWANPHLIQSIPKQDNWFALEHQLTDKFTVLYSGNLGRCHDVDTILEAAKLLEDEPIQFVFIGSGAKNLSCTAKMQALGLRNCLFLPYQDKQALSYSLSSGDLALVSIAANLEGVVAPSKLYGMMAAGRAVAAICPPHSYLRQVLAEAQCGAAVSNSDSTSLAQFIRFLSSNRELAIAMGQAGRRYLESHFTPEMIAQQYAQVLTRPSAHHHARAVRSAEQIAELV